MSDPLWSTYMLVPPVPLEVPQPDAHDLQHMKAQIEACFGTAVPDVEAAKERLGALNQGWANALLDTINSLSPALVQVTHTHIHISTSSHLIMI